MGYIDRFLLTFLLSENKNEVPIRHSRNQTIWLPFRLTIALLGHLPAHRPFVTRVRLKTDLEDTVMGWAWLECGFPPRWAERFIQLEHRLSGLGWLHYWTVIDAAVRMSIISWVPRHAARVKAVIIVSLV